MENMILRVIGLKITGTTAGIALVRDRAIHSRV